MMTAATQLDATLLALADPTRRAIVRRLALGEARVTEIAAPFPMSLNAVSKHIRALERAGLVNRRVAGRQHLCSLRPEPLREVSEWVSFYERFWTESLDRLAATLEGDIAKEKE